MSTFTRTRKRPAARYQYTAVAQGVVVMYNNNTCFLILSPSPSLRPCSRFPCTAPSTDHSTVRPLSWSARVENAASIMQEEYYIVLLSAVDLVECGQSHVFYILLYQMLTCQPSHLSYVCVQCGACRGAPSPWPASGAADIVSTTTPATKKVDISKRGGISCDPSKKAPVCTNCSTGSKRAERGGLKSNQLVARFPLRRRETFVLPSCVHCPSFQACTASSGSPCVVQCAPPLSPH